MIQDLADKILSSSGDRQKAAENPFQFLWNHPPVRGHGDLHLRQTQLTQSQTHDTIGNPAKANAISSAG